jgi:hypothetical protein
MATMMDDGEIVTDNGLMQGGCAQWLACHAWDRTSWGEGTVLICCAFG